MNELCDSPAHELVRLMSSGAVWCREVMEAHLARIDQVNPALNALVEAADPQQCMQLADDADLRAARGEPLDAAHGLPVVVKDVMLVAGLACSGSSPAIRTVAHEDATVVSRLRNQGAIVLGLTNVPEMGRGGESNNNLYGRTNNPYDLAEAPHSASYRTAAAASASRPTTPASPDSSPRTGEFPAAAACSAMHSVSSGRSTATARWRGRSGICFWGCRS
jgi:amidase